MNAKEEGRSGKGTVKGVRMGQVLGEGKMGDEGKREG